MKYIYTSNKIKFTQAMQKAFEDHFKKLEKFLDDDPTKVTLEKEGNNLILKCQVVDKNNRRVRAQFRGEDYYQLVADCCDAINKQLKKKREKSYWKERIERVKISPEIQEEVSLFVKNKVLILDSITPEQALDEMENLGHDWYAFRNVDNGDKISVVYKRFDGETFGLVELN